MNIYEKMSLPVDAKIDRVVAKKQFYDNGELSSADKKLFEHVKKIYWRYALKTENTFLQPFNDETRDYPEIEVMEVVLREEKQLSRLADVIMRSIPYPMLIFFMDCEKVQLRMGKLRQNQADTSRMILADTEATEWLTEDDTFWEKLSLKKIPTANFCALYEAWFDAISRSHLAAMDIEADEISGSAAREMLERIQAIEQEMARLRSQMKKESQFNRKVELNTRLQKLKRERAKIMEQGRVEA